MSKNNKFQYVLSLGDDALVIAQRLSEWAYRAPFLEEDMLGKALAIYNNRKFKICE